MAPINPFTPRQGDVIREILSGVTKNKQIAKNTGMSLGTVKNHIHGYKKKEDEIHEAHRVKLGIFGIVEKLTGKRPYDKNELIQALLGDVVFLRKGKPQSWWKRTFYKETPYRIKQVGF